VAINLLLDLEKEVIAYAAQRGHTWFPQVRPSQLAGIEFNPYAQQLAQVVIWIGYLQWLYHNGFKAPSDPVLEPIENIHLRDAILERMRGRVVWEDLRIFLLMDLPDGRARALGALKEIAAKEQASFHKINNWVLLRLVGRKEEAVAAGLAFRRDADRWPRVGRKLSQHMLDYSGDLLSENELLRGFAHSKSYQSMAHHFIALKKMADGDRTAARDHFRKSVATRAFSYYSWDLSRVLLDRMEKDRTWTPSIPIKK
jgi:hypothetical protein